MEVLRRAVRRVVARRELGVIVPALLLFGLGAAEVLGSEQFGAEVRYYVLVPVTAGVTLARRLQPGLVLAVTFGLWLPAINADTYLNPTALGFFSALVAAISLGFHSSARQAVAATAGSLGFILVFGLTVAPDPYGGLLIVVAISLGWAMQQRDRRNAVLERETVRLELAADAAVQEERARIARELHDSVAHTVSTMVLQTGGVRRRLEDGQSVERDALERVESAGRQAVDELRRMLGILRSGAGDEGLSPQPSLARVAELVDSAATDGIVKPRLTVLGTPVPLPSGVDLSAYRIVQEGLHNAEKHAPGSVVHVTVAYEPRCLRLDVVDAGPASTGPVKPGHGLVGMQERVALFGGAMRAERVPSGGFALHAELPWEASQ